MQSGYLAALQTQELSGSVAYMKPFQNMKLICAAQTLYNHATPRIVSQLLSQWHSQAGGQVNPHDPSPADAAGVVAEAAADGKQNQCEQELNNAMLTQQQQQQQQQPQQRQQQQQVTDSKQGRAAPAAAADLASQQQGATSILQHAGGAVLLQVPVSQCSGCATFGELFGWLLQRRGMVAAGLQRSAVHQGRSLRYVYTNPDQVRRLSVAAICMQLRSKLISQCLGNCCQACHTVRLHASPAHVDCCCSDAAMDITCCCCWVWRVRALLAGHPAV